MEIREKENDVEEKEIPAAETDAGTRTEPEADAGTPPAPAKRCRLKRILLWCAAAVALLVVLLIVVVAFFLGPIVKFGANTFGASILGVDKFSMESAKIYPFAGYAHFEKILIGKPLAEGVEFSHDVFSVELIDVDFDMSSLFSTKKVFENIEVRNLSANYEQLLAGTTNVDVLMKNLLGEPKPDSAEKEEAVGDEDAAEPQEIFIGAQRLVISDVKLAAYLRGMPVVFPAISADFSDGIGMDEDLTPVAFGMKVGGDFMNVIEFFRNSVFGDAAGAAIGAVSDAAGATAHAVSDAASATGDAAMTAAGATADAAKATAHAVSGAAGSVVNFFTGDSDKDEQADEASSGEK